MMTNTRNGISVQLLVLMTWSLSLVSSYNILGINPLPFKSHNNIMSPVLLELANRGHNLTVITNIIQTKHPPNYHQIKVDDIDFWGMNPAQNQNAFGFQKTYFVKDQHNVLSLMVYTTDETLKSPEVQSFINNDSSQFDLVICEEFFIEAYYMFAHKYNAPLVLITAYGSGHHISNYMGNPLELATVPHEFHLYFGNLNLLQRINVVLCTLWDLLTRPIYLHKHDEIAARHFASLTQPLPKVEDLKKSVSLVLLNTHFSVDMVRPYVPSIVEVGGMHIKKPGKLPADLQKMLDNAKQGVVYFNLGSNLKSSDLPPEKKAAFLKAFSALNESILWKWEDDHFEAKPSNIVVKKWMPQNDILAHPNIKLFITHGGLLGALESLYHGVPMVIMPIFGDQYRNLAKAEYMGYGVGIDFNTLDEHSVLSAINKVLLDPEYKTRAKEYSDRLKDTPQTAMERTMYWIEYVMRHKGAMHLKPTSVWIPWYQYYLVDVTLSLLAVVVILLLVSHHIISTLKRSYFPDKAVDTVKKTK